MEQQPREIDGLKHNGTADALIKYLENGHLLSQLPMGVYVCDMSGVIRMYNDKAAELWGRRPAIGEKDERFCGSYRLYYPDGTYLPHSGTPVVACLQDGLPRKDLSVIVERPDLSRVHVRVNISPLFDAGGKQIGVVNCFFDFTPGNPAEKELLRNTAELQNYIDNANVGLHWVDENGIIKWANKAELEMLGYSLEEYVGQPISRFHTDPARIEDILARLKRNETLNQYEAELRCKDGSTRTVQINSSVYLENGKFVHTRCFTIDVTAQKRLFEELSASKASYKKLVDHLPLAVYTCDHEGNINFFNDNAAGLWGYRPDIQNNQIKYSAFRKVYLDGEYIQADETPMAAALKTGQSFRHLEMLMERPDGSTFSAAVTITPIFDEENNITGAINMLVDITGLRDAEKALRKSEAQYRALAASLEDKVREQTLHLQLSTEELRKSQERYHKMVEEVEDYAIILLDRNGVVQNWNKGAEKIKGYSEEEIIGKSFQEFYLPEDRENGLPSSLLREAAEKGKAIHEGWRRRKDGSKFWVSVVLTALHDKDNNVIAFSKVTRDLTDKKIAEDKMQEYLAQLEFQNKELEQFTYAASHDLKEPLRKILLYTGFIAGNPLNKLDEKSGEYLDRAIHAANRMKALIEDLLAYSRLTSDTQGYESVHMTDIVQELAAHYKDEKVQIEAAELPVIHAISFQIKQLFSNLINNAVKYRHPDREAHIRIAHELVAGYKIHGNRDDRGQQYHKINISDNGRGFDPLFEEKIFEIFQRLNNTTGIQGSGIGLAICKRIVQNHKGYIKATGKPDEGATFVIYLPVKSANAAN